MDRKIKVLLPTNHQIPLERQFPNGIAEWGNCIFTFDENDEYDFLVVLDNLPREIRTACPKEHRLIFLGEPPYIKHYNTNFLEQFGFTFTCHKQLINKFDAQRNFPLLPWMVGCKLDEGTHVDSGLKSMTYEDFCSFQNRQEITDKVCLLTSNKTYTKGHRERVAFANTAISNNANVIDVFGNGYNSVADKLEVLGRYKYALVVENCVYPDYWTEKIGDAYLAGCTIFYHGCPNIGEYFPEEGIIKVDIRNQEETISTIAQVLEQRREIPPAVIAQCKDLVLNKYNLFNIISEKVEEIASKEMSFNKMNRKETLAPMTFRTIDKIKNRVTRKFNVEL